MMTTIGNALSTQTTSTSNIKKETRLVVRKCKQINSTIGKLCLNQTDTTIICIFSRFFLIVIQLHMINSLYQAHQQVLLFLAYSFLFQILDSFGI